MQIRWLLWGFTIRNLQITKFAKFRFHAILSTGAIKVRPHSNRIAVKFHTLVCYIEDIITYTMRGEWDMAYIQ